MTTETLPKKWWLTAANPPCSPWCQEDHDPREFRVGAAMLCRTVIVDSDEFEVDLQQLHAGDDHPVDEIDSTEITVYLALKFSGESVEIDKAIHGAESLLIALGKAKALAEGRA